MARRGLTIFHRERRLARQREDALELLTQIRGDLDPDHFTLDEVRSEYDAVSQSSGSSSKVVHYEHLLEVLEAEGFIEKNDRNGYRMINDPDT